MKTVYKYTFPKAHGTIKLQIPEDWKILKMGTQTLPVMWVLVDTDEPLEEVIIKGFATGGPLPDDILAGYFYRGTTDYHGFITHWFQEASE